MSKITGIYVEEKNAFPGSVLAVETAIPVFIGYTERSVREGKSLPLQPAKISSMTEYVKLFGNDFPAKFKLTPTLPGTEGTTVMINGNNMQVTINDNNRFYLYRCLRFFYANGGNNCYVLSVGTYGDKPGGYGINLDDFTGNDQRPSVFSILENEPEPTLVLIPDLAAMGPEAYPVYSQVLEHCNKMQNRFAIFDVDQSASGIENDIAHFRHGIGTDFLKCGAAYYPWLNTSVVGDSEIDFTYLDPTVRLESVLPEPSARQLIAEKNALDLVTLQEQRSIIHNSLMSYSPTYVNIIQAIQSSLNLLPPSSAIAGIYTLIDSTRGVWKSPANVAVSSVTAPAINVSAEQQEDLNVDLASGKSINAIRSFPGVGTLVWGARTLDGNSLDWRYINVRRTTLMIEQSLKRACRAIVFEPNNAATWMTIQSMMENFLINLWKQGALVGQTGEEAFEVQIGLGATMTSEDILNDILRVTVLLAIVHPGEFIEVSFEQQQQQNAG